MCTRELKKAEKRAVVDLEPLATLIASKGLEDQRDAVLPALLTVCYTCRRTTVLRRLILLERIIRASPLSRHLFCVLLNPLGRLPAGNQDCFDPNQPNA